MEALLIVDMQNSCFENTIRYRANNVISNINGLAAAFRGFSRPVMHIQHEDETEDFQSSSHGWEINPDIHTAATDHFVSKTRCDAFIGTDLANLLNN